MLNHEPTLRAKRYTPIMETQIGAQPLVLSCVRSADGGFKPVAQHLDVDFGARSRRASSGESDLGFEQLLFQLGEFVRGAGRARRAVGSTGLE